MVWAQVLGFDLLYLLMLVVGAPILLFQRIRAGKSLPEFGAKFWGSIQVGETSAPRLWLHAVSVGEVNLLPNLASHLQANSPDLNIVVSSTTATGLELARRRFANRCEVIPFPFDFSWAIRRTLDRVQPQAIVLAELELWPNLIKLASLRGIPVIVINGRLSERSFRGYMRLRWIMRGIFSRLAIVAAQDAAVAERFITLGASPARVHITGSLKFDDAPTSRETNAVDNSKALLGVRPQMKVWIAGSTQRGEEAIVLETFQELRSRHPELRLILVPRHAERFDEVAALISESPFALIRRSELQTNRNQWSQDEVVLIDTIGELRTWWGLADIAFVGGSLGSRGGQNMLEPAGYGAAVCFGPNTRNFRDIVSFLLAADAARIVHDGRELTEFVKQMLIDNSEARRLGDNAQRVVLQHQGATAKTVALLQPFLSQRS